MKKVALIAHRHDQPSIVTDLQEAGLIEVEETPEESGATKGATETLFHCRADQLGFEISKVEYVLNFLSERRPKKSGLVASLVKDRLLIDKTAFDKIDQKLDFEVLYEKCESIDEALGGLTRRREEIGARSDDIRPWLGLDIRFDQVRSSAHVEFSLGTIKSDRVAALTKALGDEECLADVSEINREHQTAYLTVMYFEPHCVEIERTLSASGFERFDIGGMDLTPSGELDKLERELADIHDEIEQNNQLIVGLLDYYDDLTVLLEWLKARQARYEAQSRFQETASVFVLEGWIEEQKQEEISKLLAAHEAVIDFSFNDPAPSDKVPVIIRNRRWLRPFETLTRLYGMPNYRELDPTPIMAVFFFIFFGLAIGDFGYGLILAAFCLWLRRRLLITEVGKEWLMLFALGGLSSAIVGVLTGNYFSLDTKILPNALKALAVIDPLEQAFTFLLFTWALGVVHIMAGLIIEFWDSWRRQQYWDAVNLSLGKIAVLAFLAITVSGWFAITIFGAETALTSSLVSLGAAGLAFSALVYAILSGGLLNDYLGLTVEMFSQSSAGVGKHRENLAALIILAFFLVSLAISVADIPRPIAAVSIVILGMIVNRPTRLAVLGFLNGIYNLYALTSFIGDILSYSRLMALGLATFLIGFAINEIAGLVSGIVWAGLPVGILLALVIAVPFHIFNLVINLLGAFVHPLRLQFVEFFSKFYENGGRAFRPFSFETEHLIFKEE